MTDYEKNGALENNTWEMLLSKGFGPAPEDCYFNIPIPLQLKVGRNSYYASNGRNYEVSGTICKKKAKLVSSRNRTLRRKQNPPRFQLQKYVWNTILMKPQTESHTDLSGAFLPVEKDSLFTSGKGAFPGRYGKKSGRTGTVLHRRGNGGTESRWVNNRDAFGW